MGNEVRRPIEVLLEHVVGDYLPTLASVLDTDGEESGLTPEILLALVDAIYEIGQVFDVNVHDHDTDNVLTGIVEQYGVHSTCSRAKLLCQSCGGPLMVVQTVEAMCLMFVDETTGELTMEDHLEPGDHPVIRETLMCMECRALHDYMREDEGPILRVSIHPDGI